MQMRQRDVAALDAKYTKELADAKAENDARVMMLPLVVVGCTSKQSVSRVHHYLRRDNAASPRQTPLNGIFCFHQREADHYAKQLEGTQKYINELVAELPISMGNSCNYCEQYTRASSGV